MLSKKLVDSRASNKACVCDDVTGVGCRTMSSRRPADCAPTSVDAQRLRSELEALKCQNAAVEAAGTYAEQGLPSPTAQAAAAPENVPRFDQLTATEQAAGSLGVHPEAWKPIRFMNNAHFDTLKKNNALDDTLARRIEAFRQVAAQ